MLVYLCYFAEMDDLAFGTSLNAIQKDRMAGIAKPSRARQYLYSRLIYNNVFHHCTGQIFLSDLPKGLPHPTINDINGNVFYTSLSHTGNWVALAISKKGKIAIDIEQMLDRDYKALAPFAFCESELELFKQSNNDPTCFYRLWGLKECRYKLQGDGLGVFQQMLKVANAPTSIMLTALNSKSDPVSIHQLTNPLSFEKFHE